MQELKLNLKNLMGFRTSRKIIVFESDDWGSIRMPSRYVFESLKKRGLDLTSGDSSRFNLYDTMASSSDLHALFEILCRYRDINSSHPVFTAMSVVANPDFDKIKEFEYTQYFYEPFTETLKSYYGDDSSFKSWKEGISLGIFSPQFHGREHLNVTVWMMNLRNGDTDTRLAFDHRYWGFIKHHKSYNSPRFQAAFDLSDINDLETMALIIKDGLNLFEKIFGYRAHYFVPPNGLFNNTLDCITTEAGIRFRSTSIIQHEPLGNGKYRKIFHYSGQKNKYGQKYLIRNSVFEPSRLGKDWVDSCLGDIEVAFRWNKPAIISTHRVNFIGIHDKSNRDRGLQQLDKLLKMIIKNWNDVEFMSSVQLASVMS